MKKKMIVAEWGIWPLLSRRVYPFGILPTQPIEGMFKFHDWGYNHALVPTLSGAFGIASVIIVANFGHGGWGSNGYPLWEAQVLLLIGIPLLLYGMVTASLTQHVLIDLENQCVIFETKLFGITRVQSSLYESCDPVLQIASGEIAFTRTGKFKAHRHAVFLTCSKSSAPRKMIGCFKAASEAEKFAKGLVSKFGSEVCTEMPSEGFRGRLSR